MVRRAARGAAVGLSWDPERTELEGRAASLADRWDDGHGEQVIAELRRLAPLEAAGVSLAVYELLRGRFIGAGAVSFLDIVMREAANRNAARKAQAVEVRKLWG
jgi:hypothetical protein